LMASFSGFFEKLFYVNRRGIGFAAINILLVAAAFTALAAASLNFDLPIVMAAGSVLIFYSFMTLGKTGGVTIGFFYVFLNMVALLVLRDGRHQMPYIMLMVLALAYVFFFIRFIDDIEERDNKYRVRGEELDAETVAYKEEMNKLKSRVEANKSRVKNYRTLNMVAQMLTSALERAAIVDIIGQAVTQMIGKKGVKFSLLIWHNETEMFMPAVDEKSPDTVLRGAVKIYKKDPFDEWLIANKYTLLIKDTGDFRFQDLKKDVFKFGSMIAIPLIEDKKIIGILKFYSDEPGVFDKEDARLLNYLGDLCTTAVQNSILYQKTKDLAIRDGLTGLYVRRYFVERLDEEMRRSRETSTALSFLLIDIDHFKDCNDTHGHLFGDSVLRVLGEFLKENLRDVDIIGRYGGEEFAVVLPNTAANGARFVAERLRESYSKLVIKVNENEGIKLTLSMGGVEYAKGTKLMEIINKADKALYSSKENGRNKVTFWEDIST
jgi:diguanylate cyclase (GGDEF)-like protein